MSTLTLAGGECDIRQRLHESCHSVKVIKGATREGLNWSGAMRGERQRGSKDSRVHCFP